MPTVQFRCECCRFPEVPTPKTLIHVSQAGCATASWRLLLASGVYLPSLLFEPSAVRPSPHQSLAVGVSMSVQPPVAIVKSAAPQTLSRPVESTFEERWAVWQARGDEHDRA